MKLPELGVKKQGMGWDAFETGLKAEKLGARRKV